MTPRRDPVRRWLWRLILWAVALLLLALALRQVDLEQIQQAMAGLKLWEAAIILALNALVVQLLSLRWWFVVREMGSDPGPIWVAIYRLAGFSISYFTPGPQFGGEPLMVRLLGRHRIPAATAAASVALDKTIELAVNFLFLVLGVLVALVVGLLPPSVATAAPGVAILLLSLPLLFLVASGRGHRPGSWLLARLPSAWQQTAFIRRLTEGLATAELQLASFVKQRPLALAAAIAASLLSWAALIGEYWLMARFLGLEVGVTEAVAVLAAARVAILLPLPGGLGTLEYSQTWAWAALGFPAATGLALAIVIRARDMLFGGLGLFAGSWLVSSEPATAAALERKHPIDAQPD